MKAEKVRNFSDDELRSQEHDLSDQLFKLKFQLNMGQTESLKKIRGLRKDIARVKTIVRERTVIGNGTGTKAVVKAVTKPASEPVAKPVRKSVRKSVSKPVGKMEKK
jgi:large subunit ribosomal protein L29